MFSLFLDTSYFQKASIIVCCMKKFESETTFYNCGLLKTVKIKCFRFTCSNFQISIDILIYIFKRGC